MLKLRLLALVPLSLFLTGCLTTSKFLPDDYKGPTATLADSSKNFVEAGIFKPAKAEFFYADRIDGKYVVDIRSATASRYYGQGSYFKPVPHKRRVPTKAITVSLVGQTFFSAPISTLFNKTYEVRGDVKFKPVAGQRYVVRGRLGEDYSAVWIETAGGRVVGKKVVKRK